MLAPVALALLVVVLGSRIPLPGLDAAALAEQLAYAPSGAMARFSIFALGAMPLFIVLAYAEIAKLAVPSLAKWEAASPDNARRLSLIIKSLVLALTVTQGYGIMSALAVTGLVDGSAVSMTAGIASFVGASILLIWLADVIRLPGLGNGVWLLLTIPLLGTLPSEFVRSFELIRLGGVSVAAWLILGVFLACAIAMIVIANKILSGSAPRGQTAPVIPLSVLLWPPFLANIVAGYVIAVPLIFAPELLAGTPWFIDAAVLVLTAILVPLFVFAYSRRFFSDQPDAPHENEIRPILLVVASTQVLVCVGFGILQWALPLPVIPDGEMLIVLVTVMLALQNAVRAVE